MEKITEEELQRCEGHTDGPWRKFWSESIDCYIVVKDISETPLRTVAIAETCGMVDGELANASLIALSPRLLRAYREVVKENEALKTDVENLIVNGRELVKENEELKAAVKELEERGDSVCKQLDEANRVRDVLGRMKREEIAIVEEQLESVRKELSEAKEMSLVALESERLKWSIETFVEATPVSSLRKCESEILEIESDLLSMRPNATEYADAIMCLLDSAGRAGVSVSVVIEAYREKIAINKSRTWRKNPDNSYSHI